MAEEYSALESFSQSDGCLLQMFFELAHIKRFMLWNTNKLWLIQTRNDSYNFIFKSIPSVELHCLSHASSLWWAFRHELFDFDSVILFNFWKWVLSFYDCFGHLYGVKIQQFVKLYDNRGSHFYTVFYSLYFSSFEHKSILFFL